MSADPYMERVQRRVLDDAGHANVSVAESQARTVETLTVADLGKEVRVRNWQGFTFCGQLTGIELYQMPRRILVHLGDGFADIYCAATAPVQVIA